MLKLKKAMNPAITPDEVVLVFFVFFFLFTADFVSYIRPTRSIPRY